ncbi:MAG: hypothetical protein LBN30_03380 [Oscillospiraceae bacterium]|jgi:hypothetical protein|nr:hypothetical protein [Oscillospiraceae bacterium]
MPNPKITEVQSLVLETYNLIGRLSAVPNSKANAENYARKLEMLSAQYESGAVKLREFCERHYRAVAKSGGKSPPPHTIAGRAEVNEYGWLHIKIDALLPHCRYTSPAYLTDTIARLLDEFERGRRRLPYFDAAALVIDEHCDIETRTVFDQDNKGWKAIPNALKGRVIKDDDQFTLSVHLISTKSAEMACHIYILPQSEAGDFFYAKAENYGVFS